MDSIEWLQQAALRRGTRLTDCEASFLLEFFGGLWHTRKLETVERLQVLMDSPVEPTATEPVELAQR